MTTHSEHLLRSFLWQVRKDVRGQADLRVYWIDTDAEKWSIVKRRDVAQGAGGRQGGFRGFFPSPEDFPGWGDQEEWLKGLRDGET